MILLRPAEAPDDAFLALLFRDARPYLARLPLPEEQRTVLIEQQRRAQREGYAAAWPAAVDSIIEVDGRSVGRVLVDVSVPTTVVDLAVRSDERGEGFATAALRVVLDDADRRGSAVHLRVARDNPAVRLYERLGFELVETTDVDLHLVRAPRGLDA